MTDSIKKAGVFMCKYDNRLYVCDHSAPRDGVSIVLLLMHEDIAGRRSSLQSSKVQPLL